MSQIVAVALGAAAVGARQRVLRERLLAEVGAALDVVDDDLDAGLAELGLEQLLLDLTQTVAAGGADAQAQRPRSGCS
jgi:hypothetical protein